MQPVVTEFTLRNRQQRKIDALDKTHLEQKVIKLENRNFELLDKIIEHETTIKYLKIWCVVVIATCMLLTWMIFNV